MRVLFFGTPEFALPSLEALVQSRHPVAAVVTQPPRPKGRFQKDSPSAVEEAARHLGIPVLEPEDLSQASFLSTVRSLAPELAVVVAYGRILPKELLQLFPKGAINLHASLLPRYRGAAPIQWALIQGESETGVTVFQMDERLDHGPILLQERQPIRLEDTAATLAHVLAKLGSQTLLKTVALIEQGEVQPQLQGESLASPAPRLTKEDGRIDWRRDCKTIHNRIRGVQPWPGAMTWLMGRSIKILSTTPEESRGDSRYTPGTVVLADPSKGLWVQTGQGQIRIDRLQRVGGKALDSHAFLLGHPIPRGARFD